MGLTILYRGPLTSFGYDCPYGPSFAGGVLEHVPAPGVLGGAR
ncbi:hypothetical protein [Streptomyces sp. NPDC001389]